MRHVCKTIRRSVLAAVFAALLPVTGAAEQVTDYDRFKLWNDCKPIDLVVEGLGSDATDIGLTKEAITVAARSRLRSARIYDPDSIPELYINVHTVGSGFNVQVLLRKLTIDIVSRLTNFATTWSHSITGTSGRDPGFIMSQVSTLMDRFIDEYLRVNAEACTR